MITYNHERFIRQALESVLAQRVNFDYEIVVGEDCSSDGTRAIVMDLYHQNPGRIVPFFRDRNMGAMWNFRETLASCRGQYLALLEGDDYWTSEDKLQKQVDFLDQHPDYALCCHRAQVRDETGAGRDRTWPGPDFIAGSYTIEDLIEENFIGTCTVMYRWGSIGRIPEWFLNLKLGDWPLHILVARSGKIELMDEVMAVYRMHSGGAWTSAQSLDQKYSMVRVLRTVDRHLDFQYQDAIRRRLTTYYFGMAMEERVKRNRMATMRNLISCVRAGRWRLPARFIDWASLLGYGVLGVDRLRWWKR